jgi:phosphate transport system substrate-binding protein
MLERILIELGELPMSSVGNRTSRKISQNALRFVLCLIFSSLLATRLQAQQATDVCLKDGTSLRVEQIEPRQGAYVMHLVGGVALTVPADNISMFGKACDVTNPVVHAPHFAIYGSNTIGERLMPMLIDTYANTKLGKPAKFIPKAPEEQLIELRSANSQDLVATIDFKAHGSGTAFPALLQSQVQIGMSSRRIKDEEVAQFKDKFNVDMKTAANEHVLGLDGLAVIVNRDNPIKNLALDQLAMIFSGQVTNWSNVQGSDAAGNIIQGENRAIAIHARDDKSGTNDTFKTLVLGHPTPAAVLAPSAHRYDSSEELSAAVAKDPGAIGFIGLPYVNQNHPLGISGSCGLTSLPTGFGVKTEQYALTRRLFLYTVGQPSEPIAKALLDFSLSDEAQKVVKDADFVDQSVEFVTDQEQNSWAHGVLSDPNGNLPEEHSVPPVALQSFRETSGKLRRSSIVFRFEYNSYDLDVLATQNIERLRNFLVNRSTPASSVWIVGFADATGDWNSNYVLSLNRAKAVIAKLAGLGVSLPPQHALPYSYMAPVACNDTDPDRAKNRRVEVWIARK